MKPLNIDQYRGEFFKVIYETTLSQIAVMTLSPGEVSGPPEKHEADQIIYVIDGEAEIEIKEEKVKLTQGMAITIPAQNHHRVYNRSDDELFIFNVYAPPEY